MLKIRHEWIRRAYLGNLPTQVTRKALLLINSQFQLASLYVPTLTRKKPPKINRCTCDVNGVRAYLGIYCYHEIYENIKLTRVHPHVEPLVLEGVDLFWHTEREILQDEPDLAILDPPNAVPKGRPPTGTVQTLRQALQRTAGGRATKQGGGLAPSQRRNRSHWEDVNNTPRRSGRRSPVKQTAVAPPVRTPPPRDCIEAASTVIVEKRIELPAKPRTRPYPMILRNRR